MCIGSVHWMWGALTPLTPSPPPGHPPPTRPVPPRNTWPRHATETHRAHQWEIDQLVDGVGEGESPAHAPRIPYLLGIHGTVWGFGLSYRSVSLFFSSSLFSPTSFKTFFSKLSQNLFPLLTVIVCPRPFSNLFFIFFNLCENLSIVEDSKKESYVWDLLYICTRVKQAIYWRNRATNFPDSETTSLADLLPANSYIKYNYTPRQYPP